MGKRKGRAGNERRRKLEFDCVTHQIKKNKARFMARLQRRLRPDGECLLYDANKIDGYPCITFRYKSKHLKMKVHRVFMILRNQAPLPVGFDVGHLPECTSRACVKHIELQHYTENCTTDLLGLHFRKLRPDAGR